MERSSNPSLLNQGASVRTTIVFVAIAGLSLLPAFSADFTINFLEQPAALQDTCRLLQSAGFSNDAISTFYKLVRWQNAGSNGVDVSRFPTPNSSGAYLFHGVPDFTN